MNLLVKMGIKQCLVDIERLGVMNVMVAGNLRLNFLIVLGLK